VTVLAEPELGESADPQALVRGDPEAVRATTQRLAAMTAGCSATAHGLDALGVRGWSGPAAAAFRVRHAELSARWSRAAAAFGSAARAWERFGIELVAAQELAAAAVARFSAAVGPPVTAAEAGLLGATQHVSGQPSAGPPLSVYARRGPAAPALAGRVVRGQPPAGFAPLADSSADEARQMLAEARGRRDRAAEAAAREIVAAAAQAPNPPGDGERRAIASADWLRANGVALGHVAQGVGEGVEDLVRFARRVNPADPYNLNHPGRFLANASTALAGAVDDVVHPVRQVAGFVGPGWGSDPARAYGHLLPTALVMAGAGRGIGRGPGPRPGPAALGATEPAGPAPLWADPRPTARPFTPASPPSAPRPSDPRPAAGPVADEAPSAAASTPGAVAAADGAAAGRLAEIARRPPSDPAELMPKDVAEPGPHHDPERARRARVTRADKDFSSTLASRGNRKSHLDEHGHLVPANPAGAASVLEHVVGRRSRTKDDSPYSSFTAPGARAAVDFGGSVIEVDIVRLQADIDAGRVPDVEILPPHRVQAVIQAAADRIAGAPVDLYVRKGRIPDAARAYGLDPEATAALRQRMIDMANAQRHHEWMIRGVVPSRYIIGPHPGRSHG
jgi:hypothetical protein